MLVDLTVKEFLNKVAGSDPVPGGGSIAALNGAVASALTAMVANLTIGKKNYEEHEELMNHIASLAPVSYTHLRDSISFLFTRCVPSQLANKLFPSCVQVRFIY